MGLLGDSSFPQVLNRGTAVAHPSVTQHQYTAISALHSTSTCHFVQDKHDDVANASLLMLA